MDFIHFHNVQSKANKITWYKEVVRKIKHCIVYSIAGINVSMSVFLLNAYTSVRLSRAIDTLLQNYGMCVEHGARTLCRYSFCVSRQSVNINVHVFPADIFFSHASAYETIVTTNFLLETMHKKSAQIDKSNILQGLEREKT